MRALACSLLLLLASAAGPRAATAAEPATRFPGLHVLVLDARGVTEAPAAITREIKRELGGLAGQVIGQGAFLEASARLGIPAAERYTPASIAAAGREAGAAWVVVTEVVRRGWLYTARTILIEAATGAQQMDFRSDFFRPREEGPDRGKRIGAKTAQKLGLLVSAAATTASGSAGTSTSSSATAALGGAAGASTQGRGAAGDPRRAGVGADATPGSGSGAGTSGSGAGTSGSGAGTSGSGAGTSGASDSPFASSDSPFASSDSPFASSDSPFASSDSPFASSPFGATTSASEFDGYANEGGWLWTVRGWVGTAYQAFLHPDLDSTKGRHFAKAGVRFSLTGKLNERVRLRTVALLEADMGEQRLHRALVEEGFVEWAGSAVEVRLGWDSLTWGSASTLNIIDVVNARDLSEGVIDAPKLGQPMLALRLPFQNHSLSLIYLTPFVPSRFPRLDSAFAPFPTPALPPGVPLPVLGDTVVFGGAADEWQPQAGARLALSWTGLDLRASYLFGYVRTPLIEPSTFALVYPLMHHVGTDGQLLLGGWALKWELALVSMLESDKTRSPGLTNPLSRMPVGPVAVPGARFQYVVGLEYTVEDFLGQTRLTPVVELVGDSASAWFTDAPRPDAITALTANHLIYGFDWSFENAAGSSLKFVDLWDLVHPADHALLLEYSQRWFEHFTFDLGARWAFAEADHPHAVLRPLSGAYTRLRLNY